MNETTETSSSKRSLSPVLMVVVIGVIVVGVIAIMRNSGEGSLRNSAGDTNGATMTTTNR